MSRLYSGRCARRLRIDAGHLEDRDPVKVLRFLVERLRSRRLFHQRSIALVTASIRVTAWFTCSIPRLCSSVAVAISPTIFETRPIACLS
jgi:hypothetical protein